MRTITKKINLYTFDDAPEAIKQKIRESFYNDPFYGEWILHDRIETLNKFGELIGCAISYNLSLTPCRSEYIEIDASHSQIDYTIDSFLNDSKDCPLTGCCYDEDLREHLKKFRKEENFLDLAFSEYIKDIHKEYDYLCSDEAISEHCEANGYEFTSDGKFWGVKNEGFKKNQ